MIEDIEEYANFISYLEDKLHDKKLEVQTLEKVLDAAKARINKEIGMI